MASQRIKCVAIMGATASGKTAVGIALAQRFDGEVVSMDSRQVYRGMDIGTGKVTPEEAQGIPHHLIDVKDPDQPHSAGEHRRLAETAIAQIRTRNRVTLLVGGTGLYFRTLLRGMIDVDAGSEDVASLRREFESKDTSDLHAELVQLDPQRAAQLSGNDRVRITRALELVLLTGKPFAELVRTQQSDPHYDSLHVILTMDRERLRARVAERTRELMAAGWVDEVRKLLDHGYGATDPGMRSIGYHELANAILSGEDPTESVDEIITLTQQYAKRQETFFRGEPDARWVDLGDPTALGRIGTLVEAFLEA